MPLSEHAKQSLRKLHHGSDAKVEKTMHEFKHGDLYSGSGHKVTERAQAIAIALKQAGKSKH